MRDKQKPIIKAFLDTCEPKGSLSSQSFGVIISVPCGWGKTIMALYIISQLKRKTLIIVHKEFLIAYILCFLVSITNNLHDDWNFYQLPIVKSMQEYADQYGWQDKLLEWAYNSGVFSGELYSIPKNYETMIYFYNKTLFEENGWSLPNNLEEVEALAAKIKA